MTTSIANIRITMTAVLLPVVLVCSCSHPDSLVGLWQTETSRAAMQTNTIEAFEAIEFFKDRSFKITDVVTLNGNRWTNAPFSGTYTIAGSNQVSLTVFANDVASPSNQAPLTVSCSIVGDQLEIPKFIPGVVPEYKKYRRVR